MNTDCWHPLRPGGLDMGGNPLPLFFHSSNSSVFEYVQSAHVSCGDSRSPYFLTVTVRQTPSTLTIWAGDMNSHKLSKGLQGYNNVSSLHSFASSTNEERFGGKNCISQSLTSDEPPQSSTHWRVPSKKTSLDINEFKQISGSGEESTDKIVKRRKSVEAGGGDLWRSYYCVFEKLED